MHKFVGATTYLVDTVQHVHTEHAHSEPTAFSAITIQFGQSNQDVIVDVAIEEANSNDRRDGPEDVPEQEICILEDATNPSVPGCEGREDGNLLCCAPSTINLEPPKHTNTHDILEEEVQDPITIMSAHCPTHTPRPCTHMFEFRTYDQCPCTNNNLVKKRNYRSIGISAKHTHIRAKTWNSPVQ